MDIYCVLSEQTELKFEEGDEKEAFAKNIILSFFCSSTPVNEQGEVTFNFQVLLIQGIFIVSLTVQLEALKATE